jgi:hypothetical protein
MALQEEPNELSQTGWLARSSQERRDLSASVEDALAISPEQEWDEEDDEVGSWRQPRQKGSLILPRLSLQSKQISTVRPKGFVESTAGMQSEVVDKTPPSVESTPRVNLWTRMARRVTTSLAALGANTYSEAFPALPVSLREEPQFLSWQHEISLLPPPISQDGEYLVDAQITRPSVPAVEASDGKLFEYPSAVVASEPAIESVMPAMPRQRLAGHMTRIRLQTPPASPLAEPIEQQAIDTPMPEGAWIGSEMIDVTPKNEMPDIAVTDLPEQVSGTTSDYLPAIEKPLQDKEMVQESVPVVEEAQSGAHDAGLMAFFGSGTVESGQCDITIVDAHVTSTCVVNVMLAANPGPVVVQYISLLPQTGFTIHLTAPASASAAFNYVILRSDPC